MELISLGWRDIILLLVVLAAIYLAFVLLKLIRVGRKGQAAGSRPPDTAKMAEPQMPATEPGRETAVWRSRDIVPPASARAMSAYEEAAAASGTAEPFAVPATPTYEWGEVKELFGSEPENGDRPTVPPPAEPRRERGFGEHLSEHLVRSDMEMELQRMRDEMQRMKQEVDELRAARRVSPQYSEAMELAQRGMSAQDMADRLGISLAEAELVHALSRGRQEFE